MHSDPRRGANEPTQRSDRTPLRAAFVGSHAALARHCSREITRALHPQLFALDGDGGEEQLLGEVERFRPEVTFVFEDGTPIAPDLLRSLPGVTAGVLRFQAPARDAAKALSRLQRLVSFDPALTGTEIAGQPVWRAIPPPVADDRGGYFRAAVRSHSAPRAISLGRSTEHRERMLLPAKHHNDLLQVLHGMIGEPLAQLLAECEVGVHIAREPGGGFGWQVGAHLAAGQLLVSEDLRPLHGLERNIDYLHVDSPDELVWVLDRIGRFPEMHHRIRVRGRLKAEQYRASRVFARLAHDVLADVRTFDGAGEGADLDYLRRPLPRAATSAIASRTSSG